MFILDFFFYSSVQILYLYASSFLLFVSLAKKVHALSYFYLIFCFLHEMCYTNKLDLTY